MPGTPMGYECGECGETFVTEEGRDVHRRDAHGADVDLPGWFE
jgi:hypothetical protein